MERTTLLHNTRTIATAIEKRQAVALSLLDRAMGRGALEVHREAVQRAPQAEGDLAKQSGVENHGPLEKHIVFRAGHAGLVERGTGPGGRPTLDTMIAWIRRRNIQPRNPDMTVESLAHLFRRSIAFKGTPPQPFAGPALLAKRPRLTQLVRGAVREALAGGAR